ncbi:MAG: hypothetical protein KQH63_17745 [Desulfobulbaceae bacterium]|nr:hypothetical protein [Desulfobulbaceae bacterium]
MNSLLHPLLRLVLTVFFVMAAAPVLHAEKRIGVIMTGNIPYYGAMHETFVTELNERLHGAEKTEIILQRPFPNPISWSNAARKLIAFDVDLIVTYGSPATQAVLHEKSNIPLIYAGVYESGGHADVDSKNATGCGFKVPLSSIIRYFKSLKTLSSIGIVYSGVEEDSVSQYQYMKRLAEQQKIKVEKIDIRSQADISKIRPANPDAVFITGSSIAHLYLDEILSDLKKKHIPAADIFPDDSESGLLMTLFQPAQPQGQMAAEMASQILLGKKAANIVPHTFRDTELVFNLVEARHLDIAFPIHLLIEATRVIK